MNREPSRLEVRINQLGDVCSLNNEKEVTVNDVKILELADLQDSE